MGGGIQVPAGILGERRAVPKGGTVRFSGDGAKTFDYTGTGSDERGARLTVAAGQSGAAAAEGLGSGHEGASTCQLHTERDDAKVP